MNRHHHDLLGRPGWTALSVLVITPYVGRAFFERLLADLRPARLSAVVDGNCRPGDMDMIRSLGSDGTVVEAALGRVRGLVHAKVYHVAWLTPGGTRAHTLVYGSGNATRAAFGCGGNAEMMCRARLVARRHAAAIRWAEGVRTAVTAACDGRRTRIGPHPDVRLAEGIVVRLPAMWVEPADAPAGSLDLWLQRGHIVSEYRPDPGFLRISVELLKDLPPGALERSVNALGFETAPRRRLTRPYVPIPGGGGGDERWKARYFAWTQLGAWCSASCRAEHGHLFVKAGHRGRLQALERLRRLADPMLLRQGKARHLADLERLWSALGRGAATYLRSAGRGLDRDHYAGQFEALVRHHLVLADDPEFRDRYVTGCEVIDVPRFRDDARAWRAFVTSLARQLHVEGMKRRSNSLLFQRMRKAFAGVADDPFQDPSELVATLRGRWDTTLDVDGNGRDTLGRFMDAYHRDD